jgi:long-subunit fatty acid transport protein
MGELAIGGAVEASRDVMVGLGLNIVFGDYRFESLFDEFDVNNANDGGGFTTDFESVTMTESIETDMVGVNVRAGVSADVADGLRVGLALETPTYYAVEETYSTRIETTFDNGDAFSELTSGSSEYELKTPWRFTGGLSYTMSGLTVSADAELVDWSQMRLEASTGRDELYFDDVNREIRRKYEPTINARFGAEYDLGSIALRGGYAVSPNPLDSDVVSEDVLDASRQYVSAGIGFSVRDDFEINVGWMREMFDDQYAPYTEVENAPFVVEDVARDRIAVGVRMSF